MERMYFLKMMYQIIFVNCKDIIERESEEMISCCVSRRMKILNTFRIFRQIEKSRIDDYSDDDRLYNKLLDDFIYGHMRTKMRAFGHWRRIINK